MIHQDFWLSPTLGILEQSDRDHASTALRVMLNVQEDEPVPAPHSAGVSRAAKAAAKRGVSPEIVSFLVKNGDPRLFMMRDAGWVRTFGNRIQVWKLVSRVLALMKRWVNTMDFDPHETFDLEELSSNQMLTVNARQLKGGATPEAIKHIGGGVGRYRNPELHHLDAPIPLDPEQIKDWIDALWNFFGERRYDASTEVVTSIATLLAEYYPAPTAILGSGVFGTAYLMPDDTVVKLTFDMNDVYAATFIKDSPAPHLVEILNTALLPFMFEWSFDEEAEEPPAVPLGLIHSAFVSYRPDACYHDFYQHDAAQRVVGQHVKRVKEEYEVWPDNLIYDTPEERQRKVSEAQEALINKIQEAPLNPVFADVLAGLQELRERNLFTIDVHFGNWRCDGRKLILIDFGAGGVRESKLSTIRSKRSNPDSDSPMLAPPVFTQAPHSIPVLRPR